MATSPFFGNPAAALGFVGFVRFNNVSNSSGSASSSVVVRATSADIRLSQEITKPNVVDSRFDRTVYQLGPKIVEGSVEFPALYERTLDNNESGISDVASSLWRLAVRRSSNGSLGTTSIDVKYAATNAAFQYLDNLINTFSFSVQQQEVVTINVGVIGTDRAFIPALVEPQNIDNVRIVTWNDAFVRLKLKDPNGNIEAEVGGEFIRSFNVEINNNADRFYTLNSSLAPQDIAPTKRDVSGTIVFMGRNPTLSERALDNEERCYEDNEINFGYSVETGGCGGGFDKTLPNCVFEIEEIALTNELLETTVNYHSLPAASSTYDPLDDLPEPA